MKKLFALVVACLSVGNAHAISPAPPKVDVDVSAPETMEKDHVKTVTLGGKVFEFEKTTLSEIQKATGSGEIDHSGDAAESQYWLCYSFKDQTVWFVSHGEMGGNDHVLTEVQAVSKNIGCPSLTKELQNIQSSFGWLGMSADELKGLLGRPTTSSKTTLQFYYLGKCPGPYDGKIVNWDVSADIEATIENNKVSSIYASHVTSY